MNVHKIHELTYNLLPKYFVALDIETTGLNPEYDEIVEVAGIKFNKDSEDHTGFKTLVIPNGHIPESATEIHGITKEMCVKDGVDHETATRKIHDFVGMHPVVCHNSEFDISFIEAAYSKYGLRFRNEVSCTYRMAKRAWRGLPSHRLDFLSNAMHPNHNLHFHRAYDDCMHVVKLYVALVEVLKKLK